MTPSTFTPTGARRSGDDYQDLVALDLLVEMLEHPDRYQCVRVEADDAGILDDVVAIFADGRVRARQVKYVTDPSGKVGAWTWSRLLEHTKTPAGRQRASLLERWHASLGELRALGEIAEASLVTNGTASADLQASVLPNGRIDFDRISDQETRDSLCEQLGSEADARDFFGTFSFFFDRLDLDVLNEALLRRFEALGGTDHGWQSLKEELRFWVRRKDQPPPEGDITQPFVRAAARWHKLRALPEEFRIPDDYTLPSDEFHTQFVAAILSIPASCQVLSGRPGFGKSTYLSYLVNELRNSGIAVVRHHYFISVKERIVGRLDHRAVAESLISMISTDYPEAISSLIQRNPDSTLLAEYLGVCGEYYSAKGQSLVVIIDGLDHVWREQSSRIELDSLFEYLLPVPPGVAVVVGTQPVDDERLPARLLREAPRDTWRELPAMDIRAVAGWVHHHEHELGLPDDEYRRKYTLEQLTEAFYAKSGGHPLQLRYTLASLHERATPITTEAIHNLPGNPHQDIDRYYDELWRDLAEEGRQILHLLAATRFPWPQRGLVECLDPVGQDAARVKDALRQVRHLLLDTPLGVYAFHSSVLVYISGLSDHHEYCRLLLGQTTAWLRTQAPEYWRWAYLWSLEADLGDFEPILHGPNRLWAIDSIALRYPLDHVGQVLRRSAWVALLQEDLSRFVEVGMLADYVDLLNNFEEEILPELLKAQLFLEEDAYLRMRLHVAVNDLDNEELVTLARNERQRGNSAVVDACWKEIDRRLARLNQDPEGLSFRDWTARLRTTARLASIYNIKSESIAHFVAQLKEPDEVNAFLDAYACMSRTLRAVSPLRDLLKFELPTGGRSPVLRHAVMLFLEEGVEWANDDLIRETDQYTVLYAGLRGIDLKERALTPPSELVDKSSYQFSERPAHAARFFQESFFFLLAHRLRAEQVGRDWVSNVQRESFVHEALQLLDTLAIDVAAAIASSQPFGFGSIYSRFAGLARPSWPYEHDKGDLAEGLSIALREIGMDILSMNSAIGEHQELDQGELSAALSVRYFDRWAFIDLYTDRDRRWMGQSAVMWLLDDSEQILARQVREFSQQSRRFASLAALASLHELRDKASQFVRRSAANALSYGGHKDLLLDSVLEIVTACGHEGTGNPERWLIELTPAIASVEEFTDGDETNHLQKELAEVLSAVAPYRLSDYYRWLTSEERYDDALGAFHSFLKVADLSSATNQALARTGTDDDSLQILRKRALAGDSGATNTLATLEGLLGKRTDKQTEESKSERFTGGASPLPEGVDPLRFPATMLHNYLQAAKPEYPNQRDEFVYRWLEAWHKTGLGTAAFDAVAGLIESGAGIRVSDRLFELALSFHGRQAAYPWLVRAQRDSHAWIRFFLRKEDAIKHWDAVKRYYPSQWFAFMRDSIGREGEQPWDAVTIRDTVLRLVEFCLYTGHPDEAVQIAEQTVRSTVELVSAAILPVPDWINE